MDVLHGKKTKTTYTRVNVDGTIPFWRKVEGMTKPKWVRVVPSTFTQLCFDGSPIRQTATNTFPLKLTGGMGPSAKLLVERVPSASMFAYKCLRGPSAASCF